MKNKLKKFYPPKPFILTAKDHLKNLAVTTVPQFDEDGYAKCANCYGKGKTYDPKDRDVIEGYKLANLKLPCLKCEGSGKIHSEIIEAKWRIYSKENQTKIDEYVKKVKEIDEIFSKLTDDEFNRGTKYI